MDGKGHQTTTYGAAVAALEVRRLLLLGDLITRFITKPKAMKLNRDGGN